MSDSASVDEIRIKSLLETWADAVRRHDLPAILDRIPRSFVASGKRHAGSHTRRAEK